MIHETVVAIGVPIQPIGFDYQDETEVESHESFHSGIRFDFILALSPEINTFHRGRRMRQVGLPNDRVSFCEAIKKKLGPTIFCFK